MKCTVPVYAPMGKGAPSGGMIKLSTLEIQPGGTQVTQMTVSSGNEVTKMMYSLPLTAEQHTCRHADAISSARRSGSLRDASG